VEPAATARERLYTARVTRIGALLVASALLSAQPAQPAPDAQPQPSFVDWLAGVREEAISRGIRPEIVDEALAGVEEPLPVVLERDRTQAEVVLPLETYIARRLTPTFVKTARQVFAEHRTLLDRVADTYGVPPRVIVGIWGIESNFGRFSGVRPTVAALATLAWDQRRAAFFRGELFDALRILDHGDVDLAALRGSWAGAMGQPQFLPSSFLGWAEDFDGDGRRDIWNSPADVFASIANYLKGHGWAAGPSWGREVRVPAGAERRIAATVQRGSGGCQARREMTVPLPETEWRHLGVLQLNGKRLPPGDQPAALVSGQTRRFLVSGNYQALLEYNCSHAYALTVALLADRLRP
jgi:membrane-bound lytic murein transglycosylase B